MFIEMWPDLEFDPRGDNPKNDITGEVQKLTDKTCPWVIPNGSPFVAGSVSIKTVDGQPIKTGWKEVFKPMWLIDITALDINCFIELTPELLEEHDSFVIEYHSVGASFVPRSSLEEQLHAIQHGGESIPWSKVIQIPATLPSSLHWHSKEELLGWDDLVWLVRYFIGMAEKNNNNQSSFEDTFDLTRDVLDSLIAQYNLVNTKITQHHTDRNNPHRITAMDLLIGNVDNFAMATLEEDLAGERNDVFSTPQGALAVIEKLSPDLSNIMRNGTLPISYLTSADYLPPVIDGSYEGVGSDMITAAVCLENSGKLMIARRHFDGRMKKLYLTSVENYKDPDTTVYFTGVPYENATLKAAGVNLDTTMRGSGQNVLVVGDSNTGRWWVALTNGSMNPTTHVFTELNLAGMPGVVFTASKSPATVTSTKNYIIFACSDPTGARNGVTFYRVAKSALGGGRVTPTRFNVSYTNVQGAVFSNQAWYYPDDPVRNGDGIYTRYIHSFPNGLTSLVYNYSDPTIFVEESDDVLLMRYNLSVYYANTRPTPSWSATLPFTILLRVNVTTGVMTSLNQSQRLSINSNTSVPVVSDLTGFSIDLAAPIRSSTANMLPTGDYFLIQEFSEGQSYRALSSVQKMKQINALEGIKQPITKLNLDALGGEHYYTVLGIPSPTQEGMGGTLPVYDKDGEFVSCIDKFGDKQIMVYRKTTGPYAIRPEVTNRYIPNVRSRKLTNDVYKTNLGYGYPMTQFTGTTAELTAAGVDCGVCTQSVFQLTKQAGVWAPILPVSTVVESVIEGTFVAPRSVNKTFNNDIMEATITPTSYYGVSPAVAQATLSLFAAEMSGSSNLFLQLMVNYQAREDSVLAGNLPCFAKVFAYSDTDRNYVVIGLIALNYTQTTTTVNGNTVVMLTSPVLVDRGNVGRISGASINRGHNLSVNGASQVATFYKNGNNYTAKILSGVGHVMLGFNGVDTYDFVWNGSTNRFASSSVDLNNFLREQSGACVPGVGYGTIYPQSNDGNGALLASVGGGNYLLSSVYSETGWVVYFKAGTALSLNGTNYLPPVGIVDLRDIEPDPTNKTFYVYLTCYGDEAYYIVSGKRIRHNLSIIPAAKITTGVNQITEIESYNTFMIGDGIVSSVRKPGTIPLSLGLPQDEGTFSYVRQVDFPT